MSLEKTLLTSNSNQQIVDVDDYEKQERDSGQQQNSIQSYQNITNQLKISQESQARQGSLGFSQRYSQQSYQYKNRKTSFLIFLFKCLVVLVILVSINIASSIKNYTYSEYIGLTVAFIVSFCCFLRFYYYDETKTSSILVLFFFSYLSQGYLYIYSHCFFIDNSSLQNLTLMFLSYICGDTLIIILYSFLNIQKDYIVQILIAVIHLISMIFLMVFLRDYASIAISCIFSYFYIIIAYVVSQEQASSALNNLYQATKLWLSLSIYVITLIMVTFILFIFL
ncbi:transmembrane protein, putative (macronuclear) [Tetrahymena thermophila SB210]|uniref:Transmembrane protein, putative n=1 Tax=Tetrahymena thermophila (strain SB210) TaxID=312017 RepID=W7XH06_TETTS|nr:transmembrane protein, putative [Tetrahymena thermophila SB210]EWS76378.1 transmembrane protein, putative [Tetrahymena thermophila SB210]|eukprot:XP_012651162.1 transmembrane protein, putative [Tetrahymena thermophila SB210]